MVGVTSGDLQDTPGASLSDLAAGEEIAAGTDEVAVMEAIARAIEERSSDDAYAAGILEQLLDMSQELRSTGDVGAAESPAAEELRRRTLEIALWAEVESGRNIHRLEIEIQPEPPRPPTHGE